MIKIKNSISSICFMFCVSMIFSLVTGLPCQAESDKQNDILLKSKTENQKQDRATSEEAPDSHKKNITELQDKHLSAEDAKTKKEEEQDLMEKALDLLEMADNCWKKGDIENTLNSLDKAYALVLDANGDVEIARQKDDLRLLISRRILALYSSQQTRTNGKASEIQLLMNADVEKEIRSFQGPEREFFISSYQRSGMYKEIIIGELKKAGIPEELFWLPLVESGFKVSALSRARALGLWQFIPSTGYKFGLNRSEWIDERMDILKSTQGAIAYLNELHGMFGDWLTVLAAYNCGEGRVLRVISRQHINYFDRFWDLYAQLPNETARYVPRFLATLHIIKDPAKYGFNLQTIIDYPLNYETVKVNKMMKLSDVAAKMEISEEVINILNAELRYKTTPDREYEIKIPRDTLQKFNLVYGDIPETQRPNFIYSRSGYVKHRVRSGETVDSVAHRYHVSVREICNANSRLNKNRKLSKGQVIRIPVNRLEAANTKQKPTVKKNQAGARLDASTTNIYKVKPGDSLLGIAKHFNVDVYKLKELNNLKSNTIQSGQTLKLPSGEAAVGAGEQKDQQQAAPAAKKQIVSQTLTADDIALLGTDKHIVTKGDNLSLIAQKYNMNLAKLIQMNNLSENKPLTPGQVLVVKK